MAGNAPSFDLARQLTDVTGVTWRANTCLVPTEISKANHHPGDGRILSVVHKKLDDETLVEWEFAEIVNHPEAKRLKSCPSDEPFMVLRAMGNADSTEEAAAAAMTYRAERREMAGRIWFATMNWARQRGWVAPVGGTEIDLMPLINHDGWHYEVAVPAMIHVAALFGMSEYLRGEAASLEQCAVLALAAEGRARSVMAEFLIAGLSHGISGARIGLFVEIPSASGFQDLQGT